jgi:hypothetical protein
LLSVEGLWTTLKTYLDDVDVVDSKFHAALKYWDDRYLFMIRPIIQLLSTIRNITIGLSAEQVPMISRIIPSIARLKAELQPAGSDGCDVRAVKEKMLWKFARFFDGKRKDHEGSPYSEVSDAACAATLLDPRQSGNLNKLLLNLNEGLIVARRGRRFLRRCWRMRLPSPTSSAAPSAAERSAFPFLKAITQDLEKVTGEIDNPTLQEGLDSALERLYAASRQCTHERVATSLKPDGWKEGDDVPVITLAEFEAAVRQVTQDPLDIFR